MAGRGKESDEKTAEDLIKKVMEDEVIDIPSEDVLSLTPDAVEVKNNFVNKVFAVFRKVWEKLKDDVLIQDRIERLVRTFKQHRIEEANEAFKDEFNVVLNEIFQDGITWERIAKLLYVVRRLVDGMLGIMEIVLCQVLKLILNWTLDYFKNNLLRWIREQGGWIGFLVQSIAPTEEAS